MTATTTTSEAIPTLEQVTPEQWQRLAEMRLFFGHQSVGGNLLAGVQEVLADNPHIKLRVVETADPAAMKEPGLYHARIGQNGAPQSKLEAFSDIVSAGAMDTSGVALLKYCYVDVRADTDPAELFERYRAEVQALKAAQPDVQIVHVTLPLTADPGWLRHVAAIVRGLTPHRKVNLVRHQYNEMLRETYGGREPIFDIARLESLGPDGKPVTVRYRGVDVPVLASEWTYDGGHLNETGRRRIAEVFLATLASL